MVLADHASTFKYNSIHAKQPASIPVTSLTRGHIDLLHEQEDGRLHLQGWIFSEHTPIDRVDISLQGRLWIRSVSLQERPDVRKAFEPLLGPKPHLSRSGFDVVEQRPEGFQFDSEVMVGLTPYARDGLRLDGLQTHLSRKAESNVAVLPPEFLQVRVGGTKDFAALGEQLVDLIITCVGKYKPILESGVILDWGCGCGRVMKEMRKFIPAARLHGCDIDATAINWDKENIVGPSFTPIGPYPPTPYESATFDIIYGISVMTHLSENTQLLWLEELKRIARPGAILALSVIVENLRAANMPASVAHEFAQKGFASFVPNYSDLLTESSHQGYYQEAYHSLEYIGSVWSRYFDVLECRETKHQDIIILRKA